MAAVSMRREKLKEANTEDLYPYEPCKPKVHKMKNKILDWKLVSKNRNSYLDVIMKEQKNTLAPNTYFKTEKGKQLDENKLSSNTLFQTKTHKLSTMPKTSYIDTILKDGKKFTVGPSTYKSVDPTNERVTKINKTGTFSNGILKSNVE